MTRAEKIDYPEQYCKESDCELSPKGLHDLCGQTTFRGMTDAELDSCMAEASGKPSRREQVLAAARDAVCGHRATDYGTPEDNFGAIAVLWSMYKNTQFSATDVAMMMALLKIARIKTGTATTDSFVDLAGYAACAAECAEREGKHG